MNQFSLFLLNKGFIRLSMRNVRWWTGKAKISFLEYAVQNGTHNIRREAILGLGILNAINSKPILIIAIDNPFKSVMMASIKVLKKMSPSYELVKRLERKEEYWKERTIQRDPNEKWKSDGFRWERGSKTTFENVKEMLRKPINIGKWF